MTGCEWSSEWGSELCERNAGIIEREKQLIRQTESGQTFETERELLGGEQCAYGTDVPVGVQNRQQAAEQEIVCALRY